MAPTRTPQSEEVTLLVDSDSLAESKQKSGLDIDSLDEDRFRPLEINARLGYNRHMEILTNASCGDNTSGGD